MYALTGYNCRLDSVDVRSDKTGEIAIWVRGTPGISFTLSLDEAGWLAGALSKALEEAKAAPPDATGALFEVVRGRAEAEAAEG